MRSTPTSPRSPRERESELVLTGPGAFSVEIGGRTAAEAQWIGMIDTLGLVLLLWVAYRSWKMPILGALPLATAGLAGLGAVVLLFDGVHGITVAFGFTLIGVVQDYPIHLFSHQRPGMSPWANARALWPTLATGVVSTCIAYVTFLFSGVDGLKQLAVFTIAGLGAAALSTRLLLPALIDPAPRDFADSRLLARLWNGIARLPRPRWSLLVVAALALAVTVFAPGPFWQNDLSKLTPVPADALARDAVLRDELGAPDVRYVLALGGKDSEQVLQASERLRPALDGLVAPESDRPATTWPRATCPAPRPSVHARRSCLRPSACSTMLDAVVAQTPFNADAFDPFLADVDAARHAPPLTESGLQGTPLAASVAGLLLGSPGHATALVSLNGLQDPAAVSRVAAANGAQLLDLKQASESLVAAYRGRVLAALGIAAVLLVVTVWIALRTPRRVLRVLLPMALTTLLILAMLRGCGVELNLFHLVALILAAGLGLDYALFFDHAGEDRADQLRTLHALIVCSLMTLLVFSLLALSSIPVLRAIGSTVAIGVFANFVLALLISRQPVQRGGRCLSVARIEALIPHKGSMCLWDEVVAWDAREHPPARTATIAIPRIRCVRDDRLRAVHLCEYGAQAMAVHGGLRARRAVASARPGLLVALRGVELHCRAHRRSAGRARMRSRGAGRGRGQPAIRLPHHPCGRAARRRARGGDAARRP